MTSVADRAGPLAGDSGRRW